MNVDIARAWVAALRSGKYKQGKGCLNRDGKLCCLGVLCELAVDAQVTSRQLSADSTAVRYGLSAESVGLPDEVQAWAEMHSTLGDFRNELTSPLFALNDVRNKSFAEIADTIESHWDQL